jgi:hypothetical protein
MRQTSEEYCLELHKKAEQLAQEAEMQALFDHLRTSNFSRSVPRLEDARHGRWGRLFASFRQASVKSRQLH